MIPEEIFPLAQRLYDLAVGLGYNHAAAIGVCANVMAESSFNAGAHEAGGGGGYGLGQWTPAEHLYTQAAMLGYSREKADTFDVQCDILLRGDETGQWLENAYPYDPLVESPQTLLQYKTSSDILTATMNYMAHWERPSEDPEINHKERRKAYAATFDTRLTGGGSAGSKPAFPTTTGLPITSPYGWREDPINGGQQFHPAIDIGGGTTNHPIYATQSGTVIENSFNDSMGHYIRIRHTGDVYLSEYLHLSEPASVAVGSVVSKGQQIGSMGTSGWSTGIHLDFGIATSDTGWRTEAGTIDPELYLQMRFGGGESTGDELIWLLLTDALDGWKG